MNNFERFLAAIGGFIASEAGHICLMSCFTCIGMFLACQRGDMTTLSLFGGALLTTLKGSGNQPKPPTGTPPATTP